MAEFIRGGCGINIIPKEKLHGSPSTGSEEGHEVALVDDFDPFIAELDENQDATETATNAPAETQ